MTSIASNGPIIYLKYMPTGVVALLWPSYVVWHTISRSEQKIGASEHSNKQMHTSWLALSH